MRRKDRSFGKATFMLIGGITGAGIFGLPLVFSRVGVVMGSLIFLIVTFLIVSVHLLFARCLLAQKKPMRLPGLAAAVLGRPGYAISALSHPLQLLFINAIYLLLGGQFFRMLFQAVLPWDFGLFFWQAFFFGCGILMVAFGFFVLARLEAIATWILIVALLGMVALIVPTLQVDADILTRGDTVFFPMAFGVFLFALSGIPFIGEIVSLSGRDKSTVHGSIVTGTLTAALIAWIFGVSFSLVLRQPSDSVMVLLPNAWSWLLPVTGLLAVLTSYGAATEELIASLDLDFHVDGKQAMVFALAVPFIFVSLIRPDLLSLFSSVGIFFGGINGMLISWIGWHLFRSRAQRHLRFLSLALASSFFLGMIIYIFL